MAKTKIPQKELQLALELFEALPDLKEINAGEALTSLIEKLNPANPLRDKLKGFQFEHPVKRSDYRKVLAQRHGGRAHKKLAKEEIKGKEGFLLGKSQTDLALKIFEKYAQNSSIKIIPQGMTLSEAFKDIVPPIPLAEEDKDLKFDKSIIKDQHNNIYVLSNSVLGKGNFGEVVIGQAIHVKNDDLSPASLKAGDFVAVKKQKQTSKEEKQAIETEFEIEQKATGYHFGATEHGEHMYSFLKLIRGPELGDWINTDIMGQDDTPEKNVGFYNEFEQGFMQFIFDRSYYNLLREAESKAIQQLNDLEKEVAEATKLVNQVAKRYKKIAKTSFEDLDDVSEPEEFQSMEEDEKLEALQKELEEKGFILYKDNDTLKSELYDLTVAQYDKTQKEIEAINLHQPLNEEQKIKLAKLQQMQDMDSGFKEFKDKYNEMLEEIKQGSERISKSTRLNEKQKNDKITAFEKEKLEELYIELEQTMQVTSGWRIKQGPALDALEKKLNDLSNQEFVSSDNIHKISNKELDGIAERVANLSKQLSISTSTSSETGRLIDYKLHPVSSGTNLGLGYVDIESKAPKKINEQIIEVDSQAINLDAVDGLFPDNLDLLKLMKVCINVASDVDQLHQDGILHRDLKPANILIDWQTLKTRIIDFGVSLALVQGKAIAGPSGSPGFWPPEIYTNINSSTILQTPQSDIWSLGATYQHLLEPILMEVAGMESNQEALKKGLKVIKMEMTGMERVNNIRFNNPKNDPTLDALNQFLEVIEKAKKAKPDERENIHDITLKLTQAVQNLQLALEKQEEIYNILKEVKTFSGKMEEDISIAQEAIKSKHAQYSTNIPIAIIEKCLKRIHEQKLEDALKLQEQMQHEQELKQKEESAAVAQKVLKHDPEKAYLSKKEAYQELIKDINQMKVDLAKQDSLTHPNSILALKIANSENRLKELDREIKAFEKAKKPLQQPHFSTPSTKASEKRTTPVKFSLKSEGRMLRPEQQKVLSENEAKAAKIKTLITEIDNMGMKMEHHKSQSKNLPLIKEIEQAILQAKSLLQRNADPETAFRFIDIKLKSVYGKIDLQKGGDPQLAATLLDIRKSLEDMKNLPKLSEEKNINRP